MTPLEHLNKLFPVTKRFAVDKEGTAFAVWYNEEWTMIAAVVDDEFIFPVGNLLIDNVPVCSGWKELN